MENNVKYAQKFQVGKRDMEKEIIYNLNGIYSLERMLR